MKKLKPLVNQLDVTSAFTIRQTLTSDNWFPDVDYLCAGMAVDPTGIHVVRVWPNGQPDLDILSWEYVPVFRNPRLLCDDFLNMVDDVCIVTSSAKLSKKQRETETVLVNAILALRHMVDIRIRVLQNVPNQTQAGHPLDTSELAHQAASFAFGSKLQALFAQHQERDLLLSLWLSQASKRQ